MISYDSDVWMKVFTTKLLISGMCLQMSHTHNNEVNLFHSLKCQSIAMLAYTRKSYVKNYDVMLHKHLSPRSSFQGIFQDSEHGV